MAKVNGNLVDRFLHYGFLPVEVPALIDDLAEIVGNGGNTRARANGALEQLGWGLDVLDDSTYELAALLRGGKRA